MRTRKKRIKLKIPAMKQIIKMNKERSVKRIRHLIFISNPKKWFLKIFILQNM